MSGTLRICMSACFFPIPAPNPPFHCLLGQYYDVFPHQTVDVSRRYKGKLQVISALTGGTQKIKAYVEVSSRLVSARLCIRCCRAYIEKTAKAPFRPAPLHTHTNPTKASDPSSPRFSNHDTPNRRQRLSRRRRV